MLNHDLRVGNYARVSGDKQAKDGTIASQLEAIRERVASDGLECQPELCFVDDGYTGDTLVRPGLERLRDQAGASVVMTRPRL
jgi:site-specific DNA recombinase